LYLNGQMYDLNSLIGTTGTSLTITEAIGISDFGQILPLPESFGIARKLTDEFPFSFMKCIKAEFEKVAISDAVGGS